MFTGAEMVYDFIFTASSKKGEYFFNRFIKTHNFIEVLKNNNIYTGYAKLKVLNDLTARSLWKYGKFNLGKTHINKVVI